MFFINITYLYLLYHSQHWIPCISSLVVGVEYMHIVHYINIHRYTGSTYIIHTCGMATKNKVYQIISSSNAQKKILFNIPNSPKSLATHLRPSRVILLAKPPPSGPFWITQIDRKSHPSLDSSSLGKDDALLFPINMMERNIKFHGLKAPTRYFNIFHILYIYPLVNVYIAMENHHAINGKTHYFYGHVQ